MAETDQDSKTEDATPERRRKARDEGQFPKAKDAGAVVASVAALLVAAAMSDTYLQTLRELTIQSLDDPFNLVRGDPALLGRRVGEALALLVIPTAIAAAIGATAMGFVEAGFHPRLELAAPKWSRIDPLSKMKQLFSPSQAMVNIALSLGRVAVVAGVAYAVLAGAFPVLTRLARAGLPAAAAELVGVAMRLAIWASVALAVLAVLDYAHSRFKHEKNIKMSRQELKDELHQQEGDPRLKQRQRSRARENIKRGLAKEVKSADVIVTNPTHVAVALRYKMEQGAPVVAAKGYDEIALYIRKLAGEYDIPIVENPPLARALAAEVKAGRTIPVELYTAVAEVLAFVFRLKERGVRG